MPRIEKSAQRQLISDLEENQVNKKVKAQCNKLLIKIILAYRQVKTSPTCSMTLYAVSSKVLVI